MCGRYTLRASVLTLKSAFGFEPALALKPRFNIAPFEMIPVATKPTGPLQFAYWGLIPTWSRQGPGFKGFFNLPYEKEAPLLQSLIKKNRAIIPADGFYIWKSTSYRKQPFYFYREKSALLHFAAVWDMQHQSDGGSIQGVSIIVKKLSTMGNFPLIVPEDQLTHWLDPGMGWDAKNWEYLLAYNQTLTFKAHPVSAFVNNPEQDDPACIQPLTI